MKEEEAFARTLSTLCEQARRQKNVVSKEQVEEVFSQAGFSLQEEQLQLVYGYLREKRIVLEEGADPLCSLSPEENSYLEQYLAQLEEMESVPQQEQEAILLSAMARDPQAKERLIEIFLPRVAEIARLYAGQGVLLEDLIGEGNVALAMAVEMLDCASDVSQAQGAVASAIMEAMETLIAGNLQEEKTGEKLAKKANDVLEQARELAEGLGRKVTVSELAEETGMTESRIREAVRITADRIDYLDTGNDKNGGK